MEKIILVVEDERAIADTVVYALKREGFRPAWRATGAEALSFLRETRPVLVLLDVGLPDMSGFDLCREIRRQGELPVIFLTARGDEVDRVVGLELGADDYVVKPFSPRELAARVKAVLRRSGAGPETSPATSDSSGGEVAAVSGDSAAPERGGQGEAPFEGASVEAPLLRLGPWTHDSRRCRITFHDEVLELTRYEYRMMVLFLENPGQVFSRSQLMDRVWEEPEYSLERTVDSHVKTLRAKVRAIRAGANPIRTHRGLGYSFEETR